MKTTDYISLETISAIHQQEVLFRFGHPYGIQDMGNSKGEYNCLEMDTPANAFAVDKKPQPLQEKGLNAKKHQESIYEKPLLQLGFQKLNEDKLNLQSNENRIQYLQKLGCSPRYYNRVYKARQNS